MENLDFNPKQLDVIEKQLGFKPDFSLSPKENHDIWKMEFPFEPSKTWEQFFDWEFNENCYLDDCINDQVIEEEPVIIETIINHKY